LPKNEETANAESQAKAMGRGRTFRPDPRVTPPVVQPQLFAIDAALTDHLTRQTATLVEQAAVGAESLQEQAACLAQVVSRFKPERALALN
jgi:hypothetical protein